MLNVLSFLPFLALVYINDTPGKGEVGVDLKSIPAAAIERVEVLRDGASAQYGSDAIAGVMNFVLKDDAEGGSVSVRHGEYYEGDGTQLVVDGNIGLPFTDDGFANLSFQYKTADATSRTVQRPDAQGLIIGKMFGVMVVQHQNGNLGYLAAFSGKLAESNYHKGFVPTVYNTLDETTTEITIPIGDFGF